MPTHEWREVESRVRRPWLGIGAAVGAFFLLIGAIAFFTIADAAPPGVPFWSVKIGTAVFALLGGLVLAWAVSSALSPVQIRHAAPDVLPNVSQEPVTVEGSVVHGRLTHELCEDAEGWQFRPAENRWRSDKRFMLGFGIPFMLFFAGLFTWVFHSQMNFPGWFLSAVCAVAVTTICGGSVFLLVGLILRSGYRRLSRLTIPRSDSELELDSPVEPNLEKADLTEGLKWLFVGATERKRLTIPREFVAAVQLCPWKFVMEGETTQAVQGLLVLGSPDEAAYHRLPLLLTSDMVGAARLMRQLADVLHVPYLFSADAEGWKAENARAKTRPPLHAGGMMS